MLKFPEISLTMTDMSNDNRIGGQSIDIAIIPYRGRTATRNSVLFTDLLLVLRLRYVFV